MPNEAPLTALPEAAERMRREAEENDAIYRSRGLSRLDLSALHYGHVRMLMWGLDELGANLSGCRALDVGVGEGHSSVLLAQRGAAVTGIDVSGEALVRAGQLAARYGLTVDFRQMAGEDLQFPDASFDAVLCVSVFHHMDIEKASGEFARVLRPGGRAVLIEPLASNPLAWIYRCLVPWYRRGATSEEKPLRVRDLEPLRRHFRKVDWRGMFLLTLLPFAVDRAWNSENRIIHRLTEMVFSPLFQIDEALMRFRWMHWIAWKMWIVAQK